MSCFETGFRRYFIDYGEHCDACNNKYDNLPLMIIQYPVHYKSQKEFVYFLPWKFGENEGGPPAIVSNNREYVLHLQTQLLALNLTLPDSLLYFTKRVNKIY